MGLYFPFLHTELHSVAFAGMCTSSQREGEKVGESSEDMCSCTTGSTAHGAFQDRRGGQDLRSFGLASVRSPAGRQRCALSW